MWCKKKLFCSLNSHGQSATELAIFGSILIFVIAMIFRQGLNAGNYMNSQLKATRYALTKSLESSTAVQTGRRSASVLIIEDRLAGDFGGKFGSRDRTPVVSTASATNSAQMFQPVNDGDFNDEFALPHYDVWINGQKFPFTTAAFKTVTLPTEQGNLQDCDNRFFTPNVDTRCWDFTCLNGQGCVGFAKIVINSDPTFTAKFNSLSFDLDFDGVIDVPPNLVAEPKGKLTFMWQWQIIDAVTDNPGFTKNETMDVDGDYQEEQVLGVTGADSLKRITSLHVMDRQDGDLDFSIDSRRPDVKVGLEEESQMFSFTKSGTLYLIDENKLVNPSTGEFIRNTNKNDQVDIVQRIFQLSNDTGRFCDKDTPRQFVEGLPNPVEACNNCFSQAHVQLTCLDAFSKQLFIRSRIVNQGGRSWFTRTEPGSQ